MPMVGREYRNVRSGPAGAGKLEPRPVAQRSGVSKGVLLALGATGATQPDHGCAGSRRVLRVTDRAGGHPQRAGTAPRVDRRGSTLWRGPAGHRPAALSTDPPHPWSCVVAVEPGEVRRARHTPAAPGSPAGDRGEVGVESEGQLAGGAGGHRARLAGDQPHAYRNTGTEPARSMLISPCRSEPRGAGPAAAARERRQLAIVGAARRRTPNR